MAIPPDPIDEVMPQVQGAVLAEVARVVTQDAQAPAPKHDPNASDVPWAAARQVVELKVSTVLFGTLAKAGGLVQVVKPAGDYALKAGNKGPFLLKEGKGALEIVGRYGPDTYSENLIRDAAKRNGKQ